MRLVLKNLYKLNSCAEEEHGAKLRVDRTAQNQLVALELDHGLNGYAQEIFRLYLLSYSGCDRPISGANCFGITQIQAHTTYVVQQAVCLAKSAKTGVVWAPANLYLGKPSTLVYNSGASGTLPPEACSRP